MQQQNTWKLLARKLNGEVTADERMELLQLIRSKPEIGLYLQALTNLWHQGSEENRQKITEAFEKITGSQMMLMEDKTNQHKPESSFFIPGRNSIAMNFFTAGWKLIQYGDFCEDVNLN